MLHGYARISTNEQTLDLQIDELKKAGCEKIFTDQISGAKSDRPGLEAAFSHLRKNDTLVVWKLDRLGRTVKGLIELVDKLSELGIHFKSITDGIDTTTSAGRFFFHVMAALAEMERELIKERTMAGLMAARARGRKGGRKPVMDETKKDMAKALLETGKSPSVVASALGVSRATLYRHIGTIDIPRAT